MAAPCTRTIGPADADKLERIIANAPENTVLCLEPGIYKTDIWISRSIAIRGLDRDKVVLDVMRASTVVTVTDESRVILESITLRNGNGLGNAIAVKNAKSVVLRDIAVIGADGDEPTILIDGCPDALLERCTVVQNQSTKAHVFITRSKAQLRDCVVADNLGEAPVIVADVALVDIEHCTLLSESSPVLLPIGTATAGSKIEVRGSILSGPVIKTNPNASHYPRLLFSSNAMAERPDVRDATLDHNSIGALQLDKHHRPIPKSATAGYGARNVNTVVDTTGIMRFQPPMVPPPLPKLAVGRFTVTPSEIVAQARLTMDGYALNPGDMEAPLVAGKPTRVVITAPGYRPYDQTVTLNEDTKIPVHLEKLKP